MENRKGSGIFLGVIGVATLIVAIIGATFAYFSANAASAEDAAKVTSAVLKLGYDDIKDGLKTNLIPAEDYIALYGATNEEHIEAKGQCIDDYNNEICGVYTFTVGNPSFTTTQNLYGSIIIQSNEFTDLFFRIIDEEGNDVVEPTNFADEERNQNGTITLPELNQTLIPTPATDAEKEGFNADKPSTYTLTTGEVDGETAYNRRTYRMIIWIEENKTNQTENNSGKTFAAGINFVTGQGETGVTGLIQAAQDAYDASQGTNQENPE